ncbi:MAG: hypothetical protein IPM71_08935 [Bacteroidota bacterium]|nr:MAG: hypothetical protein IPM71_08935 [Bacteroidota bacterium]
MKLDFYPASIYQAHEVFIDNENVTAIYYFDQKLAHFVWKQPAKGDAYRNPFLEALEYQKTHPTHYFVSDIRQQGVINPEDRKWFETDAVPKAIAGGVKKAGVIFEGNVFKLYYINILLKNFGKHGVPMKFFNSPEEAAKWFVA